jgi:hypothetical protein
MPRKSPSIQDRLQRLARLPRRKDLVIVGGKRPVGLYLREGHQTFQPQIALWLEEQSGFVRGSEVINPLKSQDDGVSEALEALVNALQRPPLMLVPPAGLRSGVSQQAALPSPAFPSSALPGLPAKILINEAALVEAAQALFAPLHIPVLYREQLPAFEEAFQGLSEHLGAREGAEPPQPFDWQLPQAVLAPLYQAAAGYWRRAPWSYLPDHPPVQIHLGAHGPEDGVETLYASILGALGMTMGVALYYSAEALERTIQQGIARAEHRAHSPEVDTAIEALRQAGAPLDLLPPEDLRLAIGELLAQSEPLTPSDVFEAIEECLVCSFDAERELDPTYLEWMAGHGFKAPSRQAVPTFLKTHPRQEAREPNERETRALTRALEALNQFFSTFRRPLEERSAPLGVPLCLQVRAGDGSSVAVSFTPSRELVEEEGAGFDEDDEEEGGELDRSAPRTPVSAAARSTLYRFQVKLAWRKSVWRRIELTGDQTLDDLHEAIQRAFHWDNDHLYAFFLSGKAWDRQTEYKSPFGEGGRNAARYPLEQLPLSPGQEFLYLFDFGDELRHLVKLEAVLAGGAKEGVSYPQITEWHGQAPPQYPAFPG